MPYGHFRAPESQRADSAPPGNCQPPYHPGLIGLTAPSLSWAACLRKTKVKLELMTDPDMIIFIDKSLLGGMSGFFIPLAVANNPQIGEKYDPLQPLLTEYVTILAYW